ncbi:MAG TPA: hypothetical protein VEG33_02420 [Streptosporangiaceae bacterium]|nr:hypothetical protein [Streptosporangiaceae bacterium]
MDDEDGYFGEQVAAAYDEESAEMFEPRTVDAVADVLAGLAGGGRALELGIGTGRIALPLARPPGQDVVPFHVSPARWAFDRYDVATQAMSSNYIEVVDGHGSYRSIPFRYVWPAELDLMAQLAGLRLRERWEGWAREPFTSESGKHVSIWEKPDV